MPRTLLLADDSITIQKVVAITFAAEDFTVVPVDNGEDAYARARELHPAIILADVSMPRRNGYELAHAIKSDPQLKHIPVLLLAGTFEPLDPAKASASLADGHLIKPFDTQVLIDKVSEMLGATPPSVQPPAQVSPPVGAVARPAIPQQPMQLGAPRPPIPPPPSPGGLPQRPVPLSQQPAARPSTSPFGIPTAPQPPAPQAPMPLPAARPAAAAPPPRAPLPLTSPFSSAPSAVPARPQAPIPLQTTSPFAPPVAAPTSPVTASVFPSAAAPRPPAPPPIAPVPFPRQPAVPASPARPASPFPPLTPQASAPAAPAPSPTTNLWGAPPARPASPISAPASPHPHPSPAPAPVPRIPASAAPAPVPLPSPTPRTPAPGQERRPGSLTPTWGESELSSARRDPLGAFPAPGLSSPPAFPPAPQFASEISLEVSGMAEAAAAASVQTSSADISLDVPMDEEPPAELLPAIDGFELGGSQDLDITLTGGNSPFVSGALSDFSQQGGATPIEGLDFDDGGVSSQPVELASPHEFLGGPPQADGHAAQPSSTPAAIASPQLFDSAPAAQLASPPLAPAPADGEAALRLALSQASREVIERVVWEVVPQLAEIILREHVERMERERTQA